MDSQRENSNLKGEYYSKTGFECSFYRFLLYKINLTQIWYDEFN